MMKQNETELFELIDQFMRTSNKDLLPQFSKQSKALKDVYSQELRSYLKELKEKNSEDLLYKKFLEKLIDKRYKDVKDALTKVESIKNPLSNLILGSILHLQSTYNNTINRISVDVSDTIDEIIVDLNLNNKVVYLLKFDYIFTILKNVYLQYHTEDYYDMEDKIKEIQEEIESVNLEKEEYEAKMQEVIMQAELDFLCKDIATTALKEILQMPTAPLTVIYEGIIKEDDFEFNFKEFRKYVEKLIRTGPYKDENVKNKCFKSICSIQPKQSLRTALIQKRDYMINDCSRFKSRFYNFLLSDEVLNQEDMKLKSSLNVDKREFYIYKKTGDRVKALTHEHIALLIALENVFMNCKDYVQLDGTLYLKKVDLLKLFGENFRGDRENIFLDLIRDMAQVIANVDIYKASQNLDSGNTKQEKIGAIEGNLIAFSVISSSSKDYIYQIKMPFLQELLKRSTRNTLKSIDVLKYTFQQPRKVLLAEFISNTVFYHTRRYGAVQKKISLQKILKHLGLYEEYKEMDRKTCNKYLLRLKADIDIACSLIRNIEKVEFTTISKTKIDDLSCGVTLYFKEAKKLS